MPAQFLVEDCFQVASRRVFVVHGRILNGTVRRGQLVHAPAGLEAPVEAVEFVLLSASEGRENPALTFKYGDDAQLARWHALGLRGQTLDLQDRPVVQGPDGAAV